MKQKGNGQFIINSSTLSMDLILVEFIYPVLFTCVDENDKMYIATCYFADGERKEWLIADTTPEKVISLLQNKATIRDMFLDTRLWQAVLKAGENIPSVRQVHTAELDPCVLPTEGEFMDADPGEFDEEIQELSHRNDGVHWASVSMFTCFFSTARYTFSPSLRDFSLIDMESYNMVKEVTCNVPA